MNTTLVKNYEELSEYCSKLIVSEINKKQKLSLGLATGSTPEGIYKKIIENYQQGNCSFQEVTTFNLDEYLGISRENKNSYKAYMYQYLFNHVDLREKNINLLDSENPDIIEECERYEQEIEAVGGIDIQLLGIGANGHIGFNEPGADDTTKTRIVKLDQNTLQNNARNFNDVVENVPPLALTMGINTIIQKSKKIILVASGLAKSQAIEKLYYAPISSQTPAAYLRLHNNVHLILDKEAASKIDYSSII